MRTGAVVCKSAGARWEHTELELDPPRDGEVLVQLAYAGLCYSDEHTRKRKAQRRPNVGGHEGSGIVEAVGPGVQDLQPGDHIVFSFIPACRRCRWCVTGQSYLCDAGATIGTGMMGDGTFRFHGDGGLDYGGVACLGTFSERTVVSQHSCVQIDPQIPLDVAALTGCGVPTGWGSAVNIAQVRPGDVVCVYGVGGIGANAVQGALMAGARTTVAVDPVQRKLDFARFLGADQAFPDHESAMEFLRRHTGGLMADKVIECVNVLDPLTTERCFEATRKGGTLVLAGMADEFTDVNVQLSGGMLSMYAKRVLGTVYGGCNPHDDIPRLLELYRAGRLKLDELISRRYPLRDVAAGYDDLAAGELIRGLIDFSL
jgi:alcohol dehydrogenase (nicotinoprotein)